MRSLAELQEATPPTKTPVPSGLERVVVTTADGRTFDLGRPGTMGFKFRRRVYMLKRRKEIKNG